MCGPAIIQEGAPNTGLTCIKMANKLVQHRPSTVRPLLHNDWLMRKGAWQRLRIANAEHGARALGMLHFGREKASFERIVRAITRGFKATLWLHKPR